MTSPAIALFTSCVALLACSGSDQTAERTGGHGARAGDAREAGVRAGDPLELRVLVVRADGSPAANVAASIYHTDAEGYYLRKPDGSEAGGEHARLRFRATTDANGRFTVTTIVPAPYPTGGPPAHVHLHVPPEHPDDLTIMLDSEPNLDRAHVAKMARTWIGLVRVERGTAICDAEIVAP